MRKYATARRLSRRRVLLGGGSMLTLGAFGLRGWLADQAPRASAAPPDAGLKSRAVVQSVAADGQRAESSPGGAGVTAADYLPAGTTRFGAWVPGAPWDLAPLSTIERQIGQPLGIVMWYQGWGAGNAPLDVALLDRVSARNALPMITWEPWDYTKGVDQPEYRLKRIASGAFDTYIRGWADGLRDWGKPMVLRFAHEMNHDKYPGASGQRQSPADFVAAWQHVRSIFAAAGADNVAFHWCPNADWGDLARCRFQDVPRRQHCRLRGVDGYNGGTDLDWGGWQTFWRFSGIPSPPLATSPASRSSSVRCECRDGGSKAAGSETCSGGGPVTFPMCGGSCGSTRTVNPTGKCSIRGFPRRFPRGPALDPHVLHDVTA